MLTIISYVLFFILPLILSVALFVMIAAEGQGVSVLAFLPLLVAALFRKLQFHLDPERARRRENMLALIFGVLIVLAFLIHSRWTGH